MRPDFGNINNLFKLYKVTRTEMKCDLSFFVLCLIWAGVFSCALCGHDTEKAKNSIGKYIDMNVLSRCNLHELGFILAVIAFPRKKKPSSESFTKFSRLRQKEKIHRCNVSISH
jgi:hypothetical protein